MLYILLCLFPLNLFYKSYKITFYFYYIFIFIYELSFCLFF